MHLLDVRMYIRAAVLFCNVEMLQTYYHTIRLCPWTVSILLWKDNAEHTFLSARKLH